MHKILTGKAFVYGNNIDTDQIYPGRYLELVKPEEIAKHCLEGADPTFVKRMSPGDIVICGYLHFIKQRNKKILETAFQVSKRF